MVKMAIYKLPYIRAYKKEQAKGDKYGIKKNISRIRRTKSKRKP